MVGSKDLDRNGTNRSSQEIHRLESLKIDELRGVSQQCEQSLIRADETAAIAVSVLFRVSDFLTSESVRVYNYKPVDLIAVCSARIAEMQRMQQADDLRQVGLLLYPFSSIKDVEEKIREEI